MKHYLLLLALVLTFQIAYSNPNYNYENNIPQQVYNNNNYNQNVYDEKNNTLKGSIVTVPAGQSFRAVVTSPINSATAVNGQNVTMALGSDFYYNDNIIAPAGSTVIGTVIESTNAKHGNLNGKLLIRFTQIVTPQGQNIPISAVIKTNDNSGVLIGGTAMDTTKDIAKDLAVGAGAGALAGVIISPLAGGSIGRGTALATAVGAGGGLVKSIWDKGQDVEIPNNSTVELVLTQPITVNPLSTENSLYGQ